MEKQENIEKLLRSYQVPGAKPKDEMWAALEKKIRKEKTHKLVPVYKKTWFSVAASVFVVLVFSFFIAENFLFQSKYETTSLQQKIILRDESTVTLNPNSNLTATFSVISGKRKMKLSGEALFDVTEGKSFVVGFSSGKIEVQGTVFSVYAYPGEKVIIHCIDGKIKVTAQQNSEVIEKGKGIILNDKNPDFEIVQVDALQVINELNGNFQWKEKPLDEIFSLLENRFGYSVYAKNDIRLRKFTGTVNTANIETTCNVISYAMNLDCKVNHDLKTITFENAD